MIAETMAQLPVDATLEERQRALRKRSGEFSMGTKWGAKVWPKECRKYLERNHGLPPRTVADISPQSKLFQSAQSGDIIFPFRGEGNTNGAGDDLPNG